MPQIRLRALTPLILLAVLALARVGAGMVFVACAYSGCESIPGHLKEVFLEPPPTPTPAPGKAQPSPSVIGASESITEGDGGNAKAADGVQQAKTEAEKKTNAQPTPQIDESQRLRLETAEIKARQYSGRLNWFFLTFVSVGICIVACWLSSLVIIKPIKQDRGLRWAWLIPAALVAAFGWIILASIPRYHMIILVNLIPYTMVKDFAAVTSVIDFSNSFGFATAAYLTMAIGAILWECEGENKPDADHEAKALVRAKALAHAGALAKAKAEVEAEASDDPKGAQANDQLKAVPALDRIAQGMRRLQNLLYVATLMLVSGVVLERSVFQWSLAFAWGNDIAVKAAENLSSSIVAVDGGFFTLALAAIYIPAALILRRKAEALSAVGDASEQEKLLQAHGLNFSLGEAIPKLVAILAPVLAGPIGELFSRLAK